MGIKERRDTEIAEMKKKIMDAAIEIIEHEGYEKLSIRKIASRIEYSPTTIYLYYKDKAEIIMDMSAELYSRVLVDVTGIINEAATTSIDKQVHEMMCVFIKGLCGEPEMVKAIMYSGPGINIIFGSDSADGKPDNAGISMLEDILAEGITQGIFRPNAAGTAWMIITALLGFVLGAIAGRLYLLDNFEQLVNSYAEILVGGIKK